MAGDATALVMEYLPEKLFGRMPYPVEFEKGALDKVVVVPLADDAKVTIEPLLPGDDKQKITEEAQKGRAVVFDVTVSEGIPAAMITVKAPGYDKATWEVVMMSGKNPQMSTFIK